MTLINVFLCLFLFTYNNLSCLAAIESEIICGANEILDNCPGDCDYDYCPLYDLPPRPCEKPETCPPPGCKCMFNYRRLENGTCVPTTSCPPFECLAAYEEFNPCPPYCPTDSCSQASKDGHCPLPGYLMTVFCAPTCRCIKGYWRKNGLCVPFNEC